MELVNRGEGVGEIHVFKDSNTWCASVQTAINFSVVM
jgi:hypothetical protein